MSVLPNSNSEYATREYWEDRYRKEGPAATYDWFKTYADISEIIHQIIPDRASRILMLGCGNSTLSEEMYDDGYENIVNIDYSSVLIENMKHIHEEARPKMTWLEMDIRALQFEDDSFDVVLDKGTMDALLAVKGSLWDPPAEAVENCTKEVLEALRVLRPGKGIFFYLTFGQPHFRKRYLTHPNTTLEVSTLGTSFHYYLYVLRKHDRQ
ncbi:S-adenosyl-L-methionine-dependent methyltransferase [Sistotremastrum suecicum HHB10207 ss-3]|uniref:S-adenosyl-L-methionine-dependent methyltransferase n=1 Tax=Sistotremastrum suecicum HHB10207 ss-3 TaxID=1314776 RepID=A0A166HZB2_9AGAM|nr:S-adenosyl-L-methionine-dependent methyltransferase [Sistotremastrum suecicum HHB10207 ss-3]